MPADTRPPPQSLADVQVGDEVILFRWGRYQRQTVTHATKTQLTIAAGRFRRNTVWGRSEGHEVGGGSATIRVGEAAEARARDIDRKTRREEQRRAYREALTTNNAMTQGAIAVVRAACDAAEAALREAGEWEGE